MDHVIPGFLLMILATSSKFEHSNIKRMIHVWTTQTLNESISLPAKHQKSLRNAVPVASRRARAVLARISPEVFPLHRERHPFHGWSAFCSAPLGMNGSVLPKPAYFPPSFVKVGTTFAYNQQTAIVD